MTTPSIGDIQRAVTQHFGLPMIEMASQRRGRAVARPRQIAMTLSYELTLFSYPAIARHFGNRDHTTVMHAVRVVRLRCIEDPVFAGHVAAIRKTLA